MAKLNYSLENIANDERAFKAEIANIVNSLFPGANDSESGFWRTDAHAKVTGIASWVADSKYWYDGTPFPAGKRNLNTIGELISNDKVAVDILSRFMTSEYGKSIRGFNEVGLGEPKRTGKEISLILGSEKQWTGLKNTILSGLRENAHA